MIRPLRILHVVPYFPPDRVGGLGEIVAHLHRGLLRRGHDSMVLTTGLTVDDPRVIRVARSPLGFIVRCRQGLSLARQMDIVHFQHGEALALLSATRLLRISARLVVTLHSQGLAAGRASIPYLAEGRRVGGGWSSQVKARFSALFHALADRLARTLADRDSYICSSVAQDFLGQKANDALVILNAVPGLNSSSVTPIAEPAELLYVGACNVLKRTHLLPFVLRDVNRVMPRARLRIVGSRAVDQPGLASLFRELGVTENVLLEGATRSEDIGPFYRASEVLLALSAYEGLPTVLLEAQQYGLPCVATRVGGNAEVIRNGVNGFLVDPDQPGQAAQKALEILTNPELPESMSRSARTVSTQRFNLEHMVSEYERLYSDLCGHG